MQPESPEVGHPFCDRLRVYRTLPYRRLRLRFLPPSPETAVILHKSDRCGRQRSLMGALFVGRRLRPLAARRPRMPAYYQVC